MQFKVFEAKDMKSGLQLVREQLGPDALIISTRSVKTGKLGRLGKSSIEITASIDSPPVASLKKAKKPAVSQKKSSFHQVADEEIIIPQAPAPPTNQHYTRQTVTGQQQQAAQEQRAENDIMAEMNSLKGMIAELAGEMSKLKPQETAKSPSSHLLAGNPAFDLLREKGVENELAEKITLAIQANFKSSEIHDLEAVRQRLTDHLEKQLRVEPILKSGCKQRIALVGPTGVGKTTTIAKLAASKLAEEGASIAMITIDTYRIAAVEQLKVYGEIMNIPVEVVINPEQMEQALQRHRDCDLILIDTAGRSPKDQLSLNELANFLRPELGIECNLVLAATARDSEIAKTMEKFSTLQFQHTIYTKIDECSQLGVILNSQQRTPQTISYMTNGQRVPEDYIEISPTRIAELILSHN